MNNLGWTCFLLSKGFAYVFTNLSFQWVLDTVLFRAPSLCLFRL